MDAQVEKDFLELKVMRLTMPTFNTYIPVLGESTDVYGETLKANLYKNEYLSDNSFANGCLGLMLKLPQTFGSIYLGETFKAYVTIHNLSNKQSAMQISLSIYIQTSIQRINVYSPDPIKELLVGKNYDQIISHEVKELGSHILVCEVNYSNTLNQNFHFRKFFKFQVNKPLDVKTKFYNSESGEVFLETQVQNLTTYPMILEQMALFPHANYYVKDMNFQEDKESIFGNINCLYPMDIRQYLFCLYLKTKPSENKEILSLTDVGKLHVSWHGPFGEKGGLQTSQLHRLPSSVPDIYLHPESIPDQVSLEVPFRIVCQITNFSERVMDLVMSLVDSDALSLYWLGLTTRHLGKLDVGQTVNLDLCLLANYSGFKSISGIRLLDTFLNRTYEYDDIGQIYVTNNDSPPTLFTLPTPLH